MFMWTRKLRRIVVCAVLSSGGIAAEVARAPVAMAGAEFPVNTTTEGAQHRPAIAPLANGGFVVLWNSIDEVTGINTIFGQRFRATTTRVGSEFRVNGEIVGQDPAVAVLNDGTFVVAWWTLDAGIRAQRFAENGTKLSEEFRVNHNADTQARSDTAIAALAEGGFVILWSKDEMDSAGIYGQRFTAAGVKDGPRFRANRTVGHHQQPTAAGLSGGGYVVLWTGPDKQDGGSTNAVYGQRFAATGEKIGPEFRVNRKFEGQQEEPAVARLPDGGFLASFTTPDTPFGTNNVGIFAQRYSVEGERVGPQFRVNRHVASTQQQSRIGVFPDGSFVMLWASHGQDAPLTFGVYGQRFAADGSRIGREFLVNQTTENDQGFAAVAILGNGTFVVAWQSVSQEDGTWDIFARKFAP
jgi:hypothetical protein